LPPKKQEHSIGFDMISRRENDMDVDILKALNRACKKEWPSTKKEWNGHSL